MSKKSFGITVVAVLLSMAVAAFAALNLVVGQRYALTGTMSQCHEHPGTFFLDVPGMGGGSGGGSLTARAGSDTSGGRLLLQPASAQVNLGAVFGSLHAGQKVTATGVYLGLVGSGSAHEQHQTLKTEKLAPAREARFDQLYELRRQ